MKTIFYILTILTLTTLSSCIGWDRHPKYPNLYQLANSEDNIRYASISDSLKTKGRNYDLVEYTPFPFGGQSLYAKSSVYYNLLGDSVISYSFGDTLAYEETLTGEQAVTGQYICKDHTVNYPSFKLYNLENQEIENEVRIIDAETFYNDAFFEGKVRSTDIAYSLEDMGFPFPETARKRPLYKDHPSPAQYEKAEKEHEKMKVADYIEAVNKFVSNNKEEVYLYNYYNSKYRRKAPSLVFAKKKIAFKIEGDMDTENIANYVKAPSKLGDQIEDPAITFRKTGKAYLGTDIELVMSMFPMPRSHYTYYYEIKYDNEKINFKSGDDGIILHDFYQTDKKVYFALLKSDGHTFLFEYDRPTDQ